MNFAPGFESMVVVEEADEEEDEKSQPKSELFFCFAFSPQRRVVVATAGVGEEGVELGRGLIWGLKLGSDWEFPGPRRSESERAPEGCKGTRRDAWEGRGGT